MRIALDAMGTDRHPAVEVEGGVAALRELSDDFGIIFVGNAAAIEAQLAHWPEAPRDRIEVVHAPDAILPGEAAATAVRRKPGSSIVVGLNLHKDRRADAFISAGSTGAVMAASLFALRRLPGVDRPAIATILPTASQPVLLIDAGANVDSKPTHLVQFARLGSIYAEDAWRRPNPRVGLLNIGEEPEKGDECTVEAHRLLRATDLNFVGNVLLKFYESVTAFFHGLVGEKLYGLVPQAVLDDVFKAFDYTEYGGAPLLGVNGITVICHGGSPPRAIRNAIRVARQAIDMKMLGHMERAIGAGTAASVQVE